MVCKKRKEHHLAARHVNTLICQTAIFPLLETTLLIEDLFRQGDACTLARISAKSHVIGLTA